MVFRIRPVAPADDAAMAAIIRASLREHGLALPGTAYFDSELDHLSTFYDADDRRAYFVAADDAEHVVGGCGIAEFAGAVDVANATSGSANTTNGATDTDSSGSSTAELQKLYVSPEAQGHGLAHRLIAKAERFARNAGYRQLYLETHHNLQAAVHLYRTLGWQGLDDPLPGSLHGTMDIFMSKQLDKDA